MKKTAVEAVFSVRPAFRQGVARKPLYIHITMRVVLCQIKSRSFLGISPFESPAS
jgi:hypothetical protein